MNILDKYYKKTIDFKYKDLELNFKVSQSLFSSHIIDLGTQRLLRTFLSSKLDFKKVLDMGCGYGPIGITLKALMPESEVQMTDKDALAVGYSNLNSDLNRLFIPNIYGSLGFDSVLEKDFDLIISNIPAKVGSKVLKHMLLDARFFLQKSGKVAIVVIDAITEEVKEILSNPEVVIILEKSWNGHTVFHYKFTGSTTNELESFDTGLYDRDDFSLFFSGKNLQLKTTFNLSEFDEISNHTEILLDEIARLKSQKIKNCVIYNVGQGHVPVSISSMFNIDNIILADRNLQALRTTARNLELNGIQKEKIIQKHQVDIYQKDIRADLITAILDKKNGRSVNLALSNEIIDQLSVKGIAYIASSSTMITLVEKMVRRDKKLSIQNRIKNKGESVISFKKTFA